MMQTITRSAVSGGHRVDILPNAAAALWNQTSLFKEFWDVVQAVGSWTGARITRDRNGLSLTLNGVNLGHLDWDGRLVLPFKPEIRDELVGTKIPRRIAHHPETGRSMFDVRSAADVDRALLLLRFAFLIADTKQRTNASAAAQGASQF